MTSATLLCPSSIVQPFDQKCGRKEWKSRRRLVRVVAPSSLTTIRSAGVHVKCRHEYFNAGFVVKRCERKFLPCRCVVTATVGADVALEDPIAEPEPPVEGEGGNLETLANIASETATDKKPKRRNGNANTNPSRTLVQDKDLVAGAVFTGIVRSILPFGAFVDFGAFTDGLVHISQLSNAYVNTVQDVVSVGQEVQVRILDVNIEAKRIALTMKEPEIGDQQRRQTGDGRVRRASGQAQSGGEAGSGSKGRTTGSGRTRKQEEKKKSAFQKGQTVDGKVKNVIRRGAFVELPGDEEGFLPVAEIPGGERTPVENLLPVGKEVSVRIVKVGGGKIGLSMKPLLDLDSLNKALNQDVEIGGGNAFEIAFKSNPIIKKYLAELEQQNNQAVNEKLDVDQIGTEEDELGNEQNKVLTAVEAETIKEVLTVPASAQSHGEEKPEISATDQGFSSYADISATGESESQVVIDKIDKEETDEEAILKAEIENASVAAERIITADPTEAACNGSPLFVENVMSITAPAETGVKIDEAIGKAPAEEVGLENEKSASAVEVSRETTESLKTTDEITPISLAAISIEEESDNNEKIDEESEKILDPPATEVTPSVVKLPASDEGDAGFTADEATPSISADLEVTGPPKDVEQVPVFSEAAAEGMTVISSMAASAQISEIVAVSDAVHQESPANSAGGNTAVTSALVKKLREETGAGMMDCKKALIETGADLDKARDYLRKKGLASAEKKVGRIAAEGAVGSYIHDSRIGVLIEVNCETDFVSRGEIFTSLVEDLAMQVVASPQVQYVSVEDVPPEVKNKEVEIELQREDLQNKPEQIRAKIVEGRVNKRLGELALLEQPFIKDDRILVKDLVKQTVASIGENIKVRRFVRFTLGEGLEKKVQDVAAEVAAQTKKTNASGTVEGSSAEQPATDGTAATATVNVSIAVVKQLREESGAGMMDCKKALVATNGDLEGAREYLRKKGLASADKKASRIAAEGAIGSYIHDSRIGVLIEVNCETDFVSRGELFKQLVEDLAMQVAANPLVDYVSVEDIPAEIQAKERELELEREDLQTKPENVRAKIVDGHLAKRFGELALLEQSFIKDDSILVKDLLKQTVASLGENIRIRRFVRFTLGEGLEKKNEDFAAEVAAQTSGQKAD